MLRGRLPAAGGVRVGAKPSRQLQALWPPKCSAPPWSRAETAVGCWRRRRYSCGADLLPGLPSYTSGVRLPKRAWVRIVAEKLRVIARLVLPAGVLATLVNLPALPLLAAPTRRQGETLLPACRRRPELEYQGAVEE
ncbi:hypothetical protein PF003_g19691 [Phytophthora fragariae]|nr:hypothetical protein PF003_g19691 [Phytophthora fragariae]